MAEKCYFAKNCSSKGKGKILNQILSVAQVDLDEEDLESLFSKEEQRSSETVFALKYYDDTHSNDSNKSSDESMQEYFGMQVINHSSAVPMIEIKLFRGKYERPITFAALLDTRASSSILNPTILPKNMWKP